MSENKRKTVALTTLGCKVNQFETASFVSRFKDHGLEVLPFSQKADIYVVNTCAVTGKAGAQSRQVIRRALRTNPKARIVVTGCYAQIATQEVLELADQPICVVGNDNKNLLVDVALSNKLCDLEIYMGNVNRKKEICDLPVHNYGGRTRAFLKIQDGCENYCTYCIVPYARGRVRSLELERVLAQIAVFAREGFRELVLTGIHVGMYGNDLESGCNLAQLVRRILEQNHTMRYRISSLEPGELGDELLQLTVERDELMPHFHLPLQSGDPTILKKMNRKYSAKDFTEVVEKIIQLVPDAGIGLDVLVGFPGEDEGMFTNTLELIEKLPIAYLHIFPYSKRPGTLAEKMPDQIPKAVKEQRAALLRELDHKKRTAFYNKQIGKVHQVLVEGKKNRFKMLRGFTENYMPVFFQGSPSLENKIVEVKIERTMDMNVFGKLQGGLFD